MRTVREQDLARFGSFLRHFRLAAGLTQEDLAQRSGMSVRGIRRLESGERLSPRPHTVRQLAAALQLDDRERATFLNAARPELDHRPPAQPTEVNRAPRSLSSKTAASLSTLHTPFVGRKRELETIRRLLLDERVSLLTITGPPGIGKTRLAVESARALEADFGGNVWFVNLAPVIDPTRVLPTVIEALGESIPRTANAFEDLVREIGNGRVLLVLDNLEHVIDAATAFPALVGRCPSLQIVVTSRSRLRVSGEYQLPVAPLSVASVSSGDCASQKGHSEAEELFVLRARAVDPAFARSDSLSSEIADICRRLDGLPLAIELAAAQLGRQSIADIASKAERMLPTLKNGPRDQPERLQTMTKSLEWSYSLLCSEEQELLRRLGVFRGGFTVESVRAVVVEADRGSIRRHEDALEETLGSLVERNLVVRPESSADVARYSLLELIREFAGASLVESGERDQVQAAHARYFHALAVDNEVFNWIPKDHQLPLRFENELPNFREAMTWLGERSDGERMLHLAGSLRWFWTGRADLTEGQLWLERALEIAMDASLAIRAKGLLALGQVYFYRGDSERAVELYTQALDAALEADDAVEIASTGSSVAALAVQRGEYEIGRLRCEQALHATKRIGDPELATAIALWIPGTMGRSEHGLGNFQRADVLLRTGAEQFLTRNHPRGATRVLSAWGTLAADCGDLPLAVERYQQALRQAVFAGEQRWMAINLKLLGSVLASMGRSDVAAQLLSAVSSFEEWHGATTLQSEIDKRMVNASERALRLTSEKPASNEIVSHEVTLEEAVDRALSLQY